jgi:hypothetical protein
MFAPLNDLERLLIAAATDPNARGAFTQAALNGDLYLSPAGDPPAEGGFGPIVVSKLPSGEPASAVFTAAERIAQAVGPNARVLKRNGREMLSALSNGPVHLNPNLTPAVIWSVPDLQEMLTGSRQVVAPVGAQILLAHPAERPAALVEALSASLGQVEAIAGAWLLLANRSGQASPSWLLGVETRGDWSEVNAAIAAGIKGLNLEGRVLEATAVKNNPMGKQLRTGIPIVAPKKRGLFGF